MNKKIERNDKRMKRKNGFTLIELLAVIVILAIIALIAVPVVMNIIEKANKSAFKDSAYGIIKAGEYFYTDKLLEAQGMIKDKTFTFPNDIEGLEIKGNKPSEGYVTVNKKGQVEMAISNGKYCVTKGFEEDDVTISDDNDDCGISSNENKIGDAVYYNPNEDKACTETEWNNNAAKNGKSGCMRWYIYGEEGNKQKLILDHNTTLLVKWISEEDYGCGVDGDYCAESDKGPVTLLKQLEADTKKQGWKVETDIIEAIDLIKLIPYFQELEDINTWQENWSEYQVLYNAALQDSMLNVPQSEYNSADEYLDAILDDIEANHSTLMLPRRLWIDLMYEWIITNKKPTTSGYWTKTENSLTYGSAWGVTNGGSINWSAVYFNRQLGLRPVITLSK